MSRSISDMFTPKVFTFAIAEDVKLDEVGVVKASSVLSLAILPTGVPFLSVFTILVSASNGSSQSESPLPEDTHASEWVTRYYDKVVVP